MHVPPRLRYAHRRCQRALLSFETSAVVTALVAAAVFWVTLGGLVSYASAESAAAAPPYPVVHSLYGDVHGVWVSVNGVQNAVAAYLGVPYALPPNGTRRFQPPVGVQPASRPIVANAVRPTCPQLVTNNATVVPSITQQGSEDCLYLNIWVPANASWHALPVVVYFPGAWDYFEPPLETELNGAQLAYDQNVIVVTVAYRISVFGFPGFDFGQASHAFNLGVQDQIEALRWLNATIDRFGGNRTLITIQGQASGAVSVCALLVSPLSAGLFQRAVMQSLACHRNPLPWDTQNQFVAQLAQYVQQRTGRSTIGNCGLDDMTCLQSLSVMALLNATAGFPFDITIDGYVLERQPQNSLLAGSWNRVPLLIGSTRNEGHPLYSFDYPNTTQYYAEQLYSQFWKTAAAVEAEYPLSAYDHVTGAALAAVYGDLTINCATRTVAQLALSCDPGQDCRDVFYYEWQVSPQYGPGSYYGGGAPMVANPYGAYHSSDLPFLFGNSLLTAAERNLSRLLQAYFGAFYRTGNPNSAGLPYWPPYAPLSLDPVPTSQMVLLVLNSSGAAVVPDALFSSEHHCAFWLSLRVPASIVAATVTPPALVLALCLALIFYCRHSKWLVSIDPPRPSAKYLFSVQG